MISGTSNNTARRVATRRASDNNTGLAAAGDAVQKEIPIAVGLCDRIYRKLLFAGQRVRVVEPMPRASPSTLQGGGWGMRSE